VIHALLRVLDPLHGMPEATRQAFDEWYRQAKTPQIRYVAFLTMVLYLIYAAIEWNVAADQRVARVLVHAVLVPLLLLATALASYQPSLHRWMFGMLSSAPVGAVIANLYFNFGTPQFAYYAPEIYLNLTWTFAISGLTVRQALRTASASLLVLLAVTLAHTLEPGVQRLHLIWILAALSFGMLSAFLLEKAHKRMFLHQDSLTQSANLDGLTGLWNRSCIERFLAEQVLRADRYGTPFSVVLIDIDHFKQVNDTHGHAVGDSVLRQFATLLSDHVHAVDKVGRFGGEEFLIVLPELDAQQARLAVEGLQRRIHGFDFDTVLSKTASFGIAEYLPDEGQERLLERVDRALYRAKAAGRDCIEACGLAS
jgi:diguanylate cyclase (GGDEF)-like protein